MKRLVLKYTNYLEITLIIVVIFGSIIAPIVDVKLNTVNDTSLNSITPLLLSGLLGISTIYFSCYFVWSQLYQNRYPMEIIKDDIHSIFRRLIGIIIFSVIYGIL